MFKIINKEDKSKIFDVYDIKNENNEILFLIFDNIDGLFKYVNSLHFIPYNGIH